VNKYRQLPIYFVPEDLEEIASCFNPNGLLLRRDARIAFEIMCHGAAKEDISMEAVSTFRSYEYQKTVYFKNITLDISLEEYQQTRDKVSARPGHSEHQTGLAVDINDLEQTFADTAAGQWLAINSYRFGFILRYPKGKEHITGYDYEPWHFRYLGKNLAEEVYVSGLTYDEFYTRYLI
jgi:D-alanyl-D-alanine carboxypeptidase